VKRYDKIVLLVLLAVFAVGAFRTISNALTPYVDFAYAAEANRSTQVKGYPLEGTLVLLDDDSFKFSLEDTSGQVAEVVHTGQLNPQMFEADNIVVVGRFNDEGIFNAQQILVKCPSKYEAQKD
jgi:cytochrome c-type biogenesis protein CcmE